MQLRERASGLYLGILIQQKGWRKNPITIFEILILSHKGTIYAVRQELYFDGRTGTDYWLAVEEERKGGARDGSMTSTISNLHLQ